MVKKCISICCMLIAIMLMATPYGIAMTFASGPTERVTKYFPYFSLMPFGYGNWFPIITALLSIVVVFLLLVGIRKANTGKAVRVCLVLCIIASVLSWLIFESTSIVGVCVAVLHAIALVLQIPQPPGSLIA
ncbi:hypothetical protein [Desulfitobacterium chlororespirans]|uniref:Uncharacterized protein n=1 Tax=Desulfitobacterium chlororespirans DSM 11544 TaxID=1121395 RepID=A0A1M7UZQ8_9FIRM|nr:hypothetical protein [Desulfitobacterium chlororespirans]SHN88459.1 hypothetical protein SAMN02745215_05350 [Desulfitobacterium chlororespirans DSM 11544]